MSFDRFFVCIEPLENPNPQTNLLLPKPKSPIPDPAFQLEKSSAVAFSSPSSLRRLDLNPLEKNSEFPEDWEG